MQLYTCISIDGTNCKYSFKKGLSIHRINKSQLWNSFSCIIYIIRFFMTISRNLLLKNATIYSNVHCCLIEALNIWIFTLINNIIVYMINEILMNDSSIDRNCNYYIQNYKSRFQILLDWHHDFRVYTRRSSIRMYYNIV